MAIATPAGQSRLVSWVNPVRGARPGPPRRRLATLRGGMAFPFPAVLRLRRSVSPSLRSVGQGHTPPFGWRSHPPAGRDNIQLRGFLCAYFFWFSLFFTRSSFYIFLFYCFMFRSSFLFVFFLVVFAVLFTSALFFIRSFFFSIYLLSRVLHPHARPYRSGLLSRLRRELLFSCQYVTSVAFHLYIIYIIYTSL